MDNIKNISNEKPNAKNGKQFWSNIWDNEEEHERNAEWLRELSAGKDNTKQNDINITTEMIKEQVTKVPNWESPGLDRVLVCWLKKLRVSIQQSKWITLRRFFVKKTLVNEMLLIITNQYRASL